MVSETSTGLNVGGLLMVELISVVVSVRLSNWTVHYIVFVQSINFMQSIPVVF